MSSRTTQEALSFRSHNNFILGLAGNPFFAWCHRLFLHKDGGKTSTEGMNGSVLLKGVPLMGEFLTNKLEGRILGRRRGILEEDVRKLLTSDTGDCDGHGTC